MMESWIFKPKYGKDIYTKVVECFTDSFLDWYTNGVGYAFEELDSGYVELSARIEDNSCHEYFAEVCHMDSPIEGVQLTEYMMILLIEAGVAYRQGEDEDDYILEDVEMTQVLGALSEDGTSIYSPYGSRCWVYPVGNDGRKAKAVNMLDALLSIQDA